MKDESNRIDTAGGGKVNRLDPRKNLENEIKSINNDYAKSMKDSPYYNAKTDKELDDQAKKENASQEKNGGLNTGDKFSGKNANSGGKKRLSFDNLKDKGVNTAKFAGNKVKDVGLNVADNVLSDVSDEYVAGKKAYKKVKKLKNHLKNVKKVGKAAVKTARRITGFIKWCIASGPLGWLLLLFLFVTFLELGDAVRKSDFEKYNQTTEAQQHETAGLVTGSANALEERQKDPGNSDPLSDEEKLLLLYQDCKGTDNGRDHLEGGHIFAEDYRVLQPFGWTAWSLGAGAGLYQGTGVGHTGIDLQPIRKTYYGDEDVKVYTVVDGIAYNAYSDLGGHAVLVKMSNGKQAYYGHLKRGIIKDGDKVKKGDPVGIMGNSGQTTVYHVHFEVQDHPPQLSKKDSSPYLGFEKVKEGQIIRVKDKPGVVSPKDDDSSSGDDNSYIKGDPDDVDNKTAGTADSSSKKERREALRNKSAGKLPPPNPNVKPHVAEFRKFIYEQFGITDIGGYREGDPQDHGKGLALDVMVPKSSKLGDEVAQLAIDNIKEAGITYIIWKQRFYMEVQNKYGAPKKWNPMEDRGSITQNHYDHVHISFSPEGGTGRFKAKRERENTGKCANVEDSNGRRLEGKNNEEKIWNFLLDEGFSPAAAAGLMGNMQQESNFKTDADNGTHHGIVQWGGERRAALDAYAKSKGKDIDDLQSQLEFMIKEMRSMTFGSHPYRKFIKLTDPVLVSKLFEETFERSGGQQMTQRMKYAEEIYKKYK